MITGVTLENVKTHCGSGFHFPLFDVTKLSGANGVGKSSIGDALAFAFTGRDRHGNQAPVHLITDGESKMSVSVETEKAVITRTLSRKKNSTIKFLSKANDITLNLSQSQMAERLRCSPEAFLSAAFAGFFYRLSQEKKMEVIRSVVPPVDRSKALLEILGWEEGCPSKLAYDLFLNPTKRSDIEATKVAETRRDAEKNLHTVQGRLQQLEAVEDDPKPRPEVPDALRTNYDLLLEKRKKWAEYDSSKAYFDKAVSDADQQDRRYEDWEMERVSLVQKTTMVPTYDEPEDTGALIDIGQKIADLQAKLQRSPQKPQRLELPQADRCHVCGQIIGVKHRQGIAQQIEKDLAAWEAECKKVEDENRTLQEEIDELVRKRKAVETDLHSVRDRNRANQNKRKFLQDKISEHEKKRPQKIPVAATPPVQPEFPRPDEKEIAAMEEEISKIRQKAAIWDSKKEEVAKARKECEEFRAKIEKLKNGIEPLRQIEEAYKKLDEYVFKKSSSQYQLRDGHRIVFTDSKDVTVEDVTGRRRGWMSAGEQIRADAYLCEKIGLALGVPFIFVDDADLLDGPIAKLQVQQKIFVHVDERSSPENGVGVERMGV